jgi:hypothetical protein
MRFAATWRRISESSDSLDGSRFVGRMLTVAATCRQRRHNVLVYLTTCFEAECRGQAIPSLANQPTENQSRLIPLIPPRVRLQSTTE